MKSKILHILRESDDYVSGQDLCEKFGVSRTAVWKAIKQLKEEGYEIDALHNKGYHIVGYPDVIIAEEIRSRLTTKWAGTQVCYFETIGSTNNKAKRMAEEGALHGTLVIAEEQTNGKGRRGRNWKTPRGSAIAMTIIVRPQIRPEKASILTLVMGLAVAKACRSLSGVHAMIKWPNDIVLNGKKICGILTEMSTEMNIINYLVIGAGINVNIKQFSEELKKIATSLRIESGKEINRAEIIQECITHFEQYYEKFMETEDFTVLQEEYNSLLINYGKEVCVLETSNEYSGISKGVNDKGELLVEKEDGTVMAVYSGEVSVRGVYGYV